MQGQTLVRVLYLIYLIRLNCWDVYIEGKKKGGGNGWGLEGNEYFKIWKPNGRIRK